MDVDTLRELRVGVIGPGRVGLRVALALRRVGYPLAGLAGRSGPGNRFPGYQQSMPALVDRSDLLWLTVPDDSIATVAAEAAALVDRVDRPRQLLVVHASGVHGLGVLRPLTERGAVPMAIHPAMTFPGLPPTGPLGDPGQFDNPGPPDNPGQFDDQPFRGVPCAVTAPEGYRDLADHLAGDLGGVPFPLPDERRALYHAALSFGANNLVTLIAAALEMLTAAGVDEPAAVLRPLVSASLANALAHGDEALTGPVRRGDAGTVGAHLAALDRELPELAQTYRAFARVTADRAGLSPSARLAIVRQTIGSPTSDR